MNVPLFIFLSVCMRLSAQIPEPVSADTTAPAKPAAGEDLAGPVSYEAQIIDNDVAGKQTVLLGKASVRYQDMTLTAAKITVDWENRTLLAETVLDSVWVKGEKDDSVRALRPVGFPGFSQAGEVIGGEAMTYNFSTRKGRVLRGRTKYEDGFYSGAALKMVNPATLNVADARFTSCDKEPDPHFHFRSKQMKIMVNDKVIARPIVMYLGKVPVFALPFALIPIRRGRHSGILIPRYGESSLEGRYLRDIGYYWAASDYWDTKGSLDYFEKSGFLFRGDLNYQVRYKLRGSVSGSWTRKDFEALGSKERRWDIEVDHAHELSPTAQLSVHGQLVSSGNFYREVSASREYRLQQEIRSNATLTKRFGPAWSVSINLNQTRNLNTDDVTETLPQVYIRGGQTSIWPVSKTKTGRGPQPQARWYQLIYASYSSQFLSRRSSLQGGALESRSRGWDHDLRISTSQKLFGWFNVNPSLNYRETWFDRRKAFSLDPKTNAVSGREETGFFARRMFDMSATFGTKLYGLFRPPLLETVRLRHVLTPNVGFSFQPDFSSGAYGYTQSILDTLGRARAYDRYEGSVFGSGSYGRRRSMVFGLQNLFQMKIGEGETAKRFDLFTWDFSSSYNWEASQNKLSDLHASFRANPLRNLGIDVRTVHSFYATDATGRKTERMYIKDMTASNWWRPKIMRLTDFSGNLDVRVSGRAKAAQGAGVPAAGSQENDFLGVPSGSLNNLQGDRYDAEPAVSGMNIPWSLSATLSYSESRANPYYPSKRFWIRTQSDIVLLKHFKISYQAQWDLAAKKPVSQDFVFYRDLHCWEAQVVWTPTGYYKRVYFRINIKAPMLRDIKIEKGSGGRGLYGGY